MEETEHIEKPGQPANAPPAPADAPHASRGSLAGSLHEGLASPRFLGEFARAFSAAVSSLLGAPLTVRPAISVRRTLRGPLAPAEDASCCFPLASRHAEAPAPGDPAPMRADAPAWIELPRGVAFVMVDLLLGGRQAGRYVPARRLTEIERRVLLRVIGLAAGAMGRFLPGRVGIEFRAGMETPLPSESPPGAPATVATFELEILGQVGTMRLCVLAGPEEAPPLGGARAGDGPLLLTVASEEIDVSADELATLAPGDIVVTDTPADGEVIVRVAGIPKFAARLGACDGRPAITITRKLNPGERPRAAPPSG